MDTLRLALVCFVASLAGGCAAGALVCWQLILCVRFIQAKVIPQAVKP